jgi:hypothetical protein
VKAAFVFVTLVCSSSLAAQQPPARPPGIGTRAELDERATVETVRSAVRQSGQGSVAANRLLAQQFAECTVRRDANTARTVVLTMMTGEALRRSFPDFLRDRCFGDGQATQTVLRMAFPDNTLHVVLADALLRSEFAAAGPADFASVPPQVRSERPTTATAQELAAMSALSQTARAESDANAANWYVVERIGECAARLLPERVRLLAQTQAASTEERAALAAIQPALGSCLPPGTTVRLRPDDVRGAAVLAYYRMAHAAPAAAQGTP